ncbi:hypothetical protein MtrunA17_Chr1g0158401 [Medicago truncatula]|uniref:Uncharacterized protein n=1 Tax=Medicago truncatula TaxID=3880 RepID=A0A396JHS3_MEDTR|nr:hypothetical protein MtrunA17_Chr1g0158401 [Medicago truncatula]
MDCYDFDVIALCGWLTGFGGDVRDVGLVFCDFADDVGFLCLLLVYDGIRQGLELGLMQNLAAFLVFFLDVLL